MCKEIPHFLHTPLPTGFHFQTQEECSLGKVLCDKGCPGCKMTEALLVKAPDPLDEMLHLPIGRTQFMEFTDKVIKYAEVDADHEGQRFALADAVVHLPPGKSMEKLGYFVHLLRKIAVNQTCVMMRQELHAECKRRIDAEESAKKEAERKAACKGCPPDTEACGTCSLGGSPEVPVV